MVQIAVLTGDIVESTRLGPARLTAVLHGLEQSCDAIRAWDGITEIRFSRVSGDGWQVALRPEKFALRVATALRAGHLSRHPDSDTRISLAIGDGPASLPADLNTASGPAFTASGRAIADIPDWARMRFQGDAATQATVLLLDKMISGWTANQAGLVADLLSLPTPTQSRVAKDHGKTPQAVSKALHAAGYPALEAALTLLEGGQDHAG